MSLIGISAKFPDWEKKFAGRLDEMFLFIAAQLQTNRGLMFDSSNAGRNTPWKDPLLREGMPLSARGTLRKSWAPQMGGSRPGTSESSILRIAGGIVTIGTNLPHAPILNNGGVIHPKKSKWLWIPLPKGSAMSSQAPTDTARELRKSAGRKPKNTEWKWTKKPGQPIIVLGPGGKVWMLAKQARIPARPMNEWSKEDERELSEAISRKIEEVLR